MKYQIDFKDYSNGATSPIDTVVARKGYTAEQYIADCEENADKDWCEMLRGGEVIVIAIDDEETEHDYWLDTAYHIGDDSESKWALMDGDDVVMWKRYADTGKGMELGLFGGIDWEIKENLGFLPEYSVN